MTVFAVILFILGFIAIVGGLVSGNKTGVGIGLIAAAFLFVGGYWMQTHRVIKANNVGIARNTLTQEFTDIQQAGLINKPFFGQVYSFPASTDYELCERYFPPIEGSYEIYMDVCPYLNLSEVDWLAEIEKTGSFDSDVIMGVWKKGITVDVALVVTDKSPEDMNEKVAQIEAALYENTKSWYEARGIVSNRVVFAYWDFSSEEVGAEYDKSILIRREVTNQDALLEIAQKERILDLYKADTERQVSLFNIETLQLISTEQLVAADNAGIRDEDLLEWLWMNYFRDSGTAPDYMILGGNNSEPAIAVSP